MQTDPNDIFSFFHPLTDRLRAQGVRLELHEGPRPLTRPLRVRSDRFPLAGPRQLPSPTPVHEPTAEHDAKAPAQDGNPVPADVCRTGVAQSDGDAPPAAAAATANCDGQRAGRKWPTSANGGRGQREREHDGHAASSSTSASTPATAATSSWPDGTGDGRGEREWTLDGQPRATGHIGAGRNVGLAVVVGAEFKKFIIFSIHV